MLSGDNGLLKRAGDARDDTIIGQEKEQVELAYVSAAVKKLGDNVDKDDLQTELNSSVGNNKTLVTGTGTLNAHFYDTNHNYTVNGGIVTRVADGEPEISTTTLGANYQDSWIGKKIDYKSGTNNVNDWIILGKQVNAQGKNDIIITTKNSLSTLQINHTLAEWTGYENKVKNECKAYVGETGTLGSKAATIKEVRSITVNDINNALGFNETINSVTISSSNGGYAYPNSTGTGWIKNTDAEYSSYTFPTEAYYYYNYDGFTFNSVTNGESNVPITFGKLTNWTYISANGDLYWVASRGVWALDGGAEFGVATACNNGIQCGGSNGFDYNLCYSWNNENGDYGGSSSLAFRPVVVLSSEIPWSDVENLIGDYVTYN